MTHESDPPRLLLVAQSARILAESARRGGYRAWVVDSFGDLDTRAAAERCIASAGLDQATVLAAAQQAAQAGAWGVVYGGDLECRPQLLQHLQCHLPLLGNEVALLQRCKTPESFFRLLDELAIPYPETRWEPPSFPHREAAWLLKSGCGAGGFGVRCWVNYGEWRSGDYWQRVIAGIPMSALFLSDGRRVALIGFNRLWTQAHAATPFLCAGADNGAAPSQPAEVRAWLERLVTATGLKGLMGLDFIDDGARCWALEINPRPSASLALYDEDFPAGLLRAHLEALAGRLSVPRSPTSVYRAWRVLYAAAPCRIPEGLAWPEGCKDLPPAGTAIAPGQPLCSATAAGTSPEHCAALLQQRVQALWRLFHGRESRAIRWVAARAASAID